MLDPAPRLRPPARVPPLMPVALAFATGIVADKYAAPLRTQAWAWVALGCAVVALATVKFKGVGAVAILGAAVALAAGWHHHSWYDLDGDDLARAVNETPRPAWLRGTIRDVIGFRPSFKVETEGTTRAVLDVTGVKTKDGWKPATGRTLLSIAGKKDGLAAGQDVEAAGVLARVAGPLNPGEFDYRAHLRAQGVRLKLAVESDKGVWKDESAKFLYKNITITNKINQFLGTAREWSRRGLRRAIEPRAEPLAEALLLGRKERVDPDLNDAFTRTGTTHLLAISGLHMQALALALGGALRLAGLGRKGTLANVAGATVAYALLVGLMPSVVRSAAMTMTYCAAGLFDRHSGRANLLAAAALVALGLNPAHLFDVGCQLSFLAVAVIVWGVEPISKRILPENPRNPLRALERFYESRWKTAARRCIAWLLRGIALSTIVWLAAAPLVALRFHIVSPINIPLNVPLIPMTSGALLAAGVALGLSAVWEPLGRPAAWIGARLLDGTAVVVRWGEERSWGHAFVPEPSWGWVAIFYGALGLAAAAWLGRWPGRKTAAGAVVAWVAVGAGLGLAPSVFDQNGEPPRAEALAVDHGLAVLVQTGGGHALLYDCGRMRDPSVGRRIVAPALRARGVWQLDAVLLSHADADHYNGLSELLELIKVGAVLVAEGFESAENPGAVKLLELVRKNGVPVRTVAAGDAWNTGSTRFEVRHPAKGWNPSATDNARSIVLDVSWRGRHVLLTGDLEGDGLSTFADGSPAPPGPVDVLLSPHHGGRTANPEWLFDRVNPSTVVVSQRAPPAGSRDALAPIAARGIPVWRTWEYGAVRLTWTHEGVRLRGFKEERGRWAYEENEY